MLVHAPARGGTSVRRLIRSLLPLGFVTALVGVVNAFISPYLPLFLSGTLHVSPVYTAVLLFLTPMSTVGVATVVGRASDRPGRRRPLLIAAAAAGLLGFVLYALLREYWTLLLISVSLVALSGSLMAQIFAFGREVLDRTDPSRAAMGISWLRTLLSVSWVAGPPLGALLIGTVGFRGLYLCTAAGYVAILVVLVTWLREPGRPAAGADPGEPVPAAPERIGGARASTATLLGTGLAFVLMQCAAALNVQAMPQFVGVDLHGSVRGAGLVLGLCAALEIPLMLLFGALAGRWPLRRLMLLGAVFGVAYYATASLSGRPWHLAAAQVLNACFISAATGLGISYFQDLLPGLPGRATTLFTNTNRISAMLAGPVYGVAQHVGYRFAYGVGTGLCAAGLVLLALTPHRRPGRPAVGQ